MKIVRTHKIGNTPASVSRDQGVIYINPSLFDKLTPFQQKFILLHEEGHYVLDTSNEESADGYAFYKLAGSEFKSLKQSLNCLSTVLDKSNPEHVSRYNALYLKALQWDADNGNNWAKDEIARIYQTKTLDNFRFTTDSYLEAEASKEVGLAQAKALLSAASDSSKVIDWENSKTILSMILAVAILCAAAYFLIIKRS